MTLYFYTETSPTLKAYLDDVIISFSPYIVNDIFRGRVTLGMAAYEKGSKECDVLLKYKNKMGLFVSEEPIIDNPFNSQMEDVSEVRKPKAKPTVESVPEQAKVEPEENQEIQEEPQKEVKKKKKLDDFALRDILRGE